MDVFVLAGEPSGDVHGAKLIEALLKKNPRLKIGAVAGPRMRKLPIECVAEMESLQTMGFVDVAVALPRIARFFFRVRKEILARQPKVFVGIDYADFNLRMHRSLKKQGFSGKCVQYICPTVWAWRKGRIGFMERWVDELLTILPFEVDCFRETKLPAHYVGHPLVEAVGKFVADVEFRARHHILPEQKVLALFPGSREHEIRKNLPLMLQAANRLQQQDARVRVVISSPQGKQLVPDVLHVSETYDLMHQAHLALAKSGTVALELALHKVPTVVQYAIKPWDLFLAQKVFRIALDHYSLPNLLLQETVFPELYGPNLTEESLCGAAKELWFDEKQRDECKVGCERLWEVLGKKVTSEVAAEKVLRTFLTKTG